MIRLPRWKQGKWAARLSAEVAVTTAEEDSASARSREHALLSVFVERRMDLGLPCDLGSLLQDLLEPPLEVVGSLPIDNYVSPRARSELAASLNTLLVSPSFVNWRQGAPLRIGEWLKPARERGDGKTPVVMSVSLTSTTTTTARWCLAYCSKRC